MADKTQLRGNCQCCGRDQAVIARGTMSQHGYTVEHGWFSGVCSGHQFKPMQQDRSVTDRIIAQVREEIKTLEQRVADLKAGKVFPQTVRVSHAPKAEPVLYKDAPEWAQRDGVRTAIFQTESRIRAGEHFCRDMGALVDACHGQPLREVVVETDAKVIKVGSQVKVHGRVVTVTKIEYRTCRGVGPSLNGQHIEHVFWMDGDKERAYPKRFARLVSQ